MIEKKKLNNKTIGRGRETRHTFRTAVLLRTTAVVLPAAYS